MHELERIKVVLVGTTHPGNIGASARAMKTMGLSRLSLVAPKSFPHPEASARAAGADDLLLSAENHPSLQSATAESRLVVGTTARPRRLEWPVLAPREAAAEILAAAANGEVSLVFGREKAGLSNDEIEHCDKLIRIPTRGLLQLAQSRPRRSDLCVRIGDCCRRAAAYARSDDDLAATRDALNRLYDHFIEVMEEVGYFDPDNPKLLPRRIRRLINRARVSEKEAQILRGFLAAVQRKLPRN